MTAYKPLTSSDWYNHTPRTPQTEHSFGKGMLISASLSVFTQHSRRYQDYAGFLKKRSSLEEDHANGLRRLAKSHQESIHKPDERQGSYVRQLEQVMHQHERMADNGMQFTLSVHQMHEDLTELSRRLEASRKHWKHEGPVSYTHLTLPTKRIV